jgi:predicted Rossmann-fold nucleotide-binding protein
MRKRTIEVTTEEIMSALWEGSDILGTAEPLIFCGQEEFDPILEIVDNKLVSIEYFTEL